MGKIDIKIKVNNYKINTKGIKQKNIITCIDNNDNQTKIKIDTENLILKRENNDIIINIDFKNKNIEYYLKEHNKKVNTPIKVNKIRKQPQKIKINYINEEEFALEITYK